MKVLSRPCLTGAISLVAALIIATTQAQAQVTAYGSSSSFDSALATANLVGTTYGFTGTSGVDDPSGLTSGPATFAGQNTGTGFSFFLSDSDGITGEFYSHQLSDQSTGNTVLITFATPVRGFSFDSNTWNFASDPVNNPNNWPTSGTTALTLTTSNSTVLGLSTAAYAGFAPAPTEFNGIISTTPFTSVTLSIPQGQQFQITDFTVAAAVPEPASYAMLLVGLMVVGVVTRRRALRSISLPA
jgi:hypothetical protein